MVCSSASTSQVGAGSIKFGVKMVTKPSRFSKPIASPAVTARRSLLRRIRRQEVRKLRALLPTLRQQRQADELAVVQEAVKYIDQLHSTILARLYSGSLSFESVSERLHPFTIQQIQNRLAPSSDENRFQDVTRQGGQQVRSAEDEQRIRLINKMAFY